jgi:adenylate cyclase
MLIDERKLNATVSWLVAGAQPAKTIDEITMECAERLNVMGVPVDVLTINGFFIHPEIGGMQIRWTKRNGVRRATFDHKFFETAVFKDSGIAACINTGRTQRYNIETDAEGETNPYRKSFQKAGYTDLIIMPLINFDGTANGCVEIGTTSKTGFVVDAVTALRRMQAPLARMKECFTERFDKQITLATYVGEKTSLKVLRGNIVLGEGETISAVILFADIVGFTEISNHSRSTEVLSTLNTFFAAIDKAVAANNGEILKFLGDGVLAIFQTPDDLTAQEAAASSALDAITMARKDLAEVGVGAPIEFRASLHVGDVFFGNIGSGRRLDFTAIGPAVNLASRILAEAASLNAKTVCSEAFQKLVSDQSSPSIDCQFKGFGEPEKVFVLDQ